MEKRGELSMVHYMRNLRGLREDNDKTQQEIAQVLGIAQTTYARYERGANELPMRHFINLCEYYDVSADYVLEFTPKYRRKAEKKLRGKE